MNSQLKVLVLTAHPDPGSLTVAVAHTVVSTLSRDGHDVLFQNLAEMGFWPAFTAEDVAAYRELSAGRPFTLPEDVLEQQRILATSDALVIVFPVYWWSLPAHIKGWLDRVFTRGWAYGSKDNVLGHLKVHLIALTGGDAGLYDRHEYQRIAETHISHGVFERCGISQVKITWLWEAARWPTAALAEAGAKKSFLKPEGVS
ncbi:NAD(P)H-dependent oxidoreductase [Paenarthrobacter aurescens]|uniref:NAD(P)H-dependent oxidoreductase n=1 Tax=Paenarthrobacter aurescens TaxID=43663 RepID=UPI0035EE8492